MKVGEITQKRGDRAIADQEFAFERLLACRSIECATCGFIEHGISAGIVDKQLDPYPDAAVFCARCGRSNRDRLLDSHYHLVFT